MANEVTIVAGVSASKNGAVVNPGTSTKQLTMTGDDMISSTVNVTAAAGGQQITWGGISGAPGVVCIKNLDAANFVTFAGQTGFTDVLQIKLLAGESAIFYPASATLWAKADTAAVNVLIVAVEV